MSINNKVPTRIVDKNGVETTRHKNPEMQDIKNRIKAMPPPAPAAIVIEEENIYTDRAGLPTQRYTITNSNVSKFAHVIGKANARLKRAGIEERFTYELNSDVEYKQDGTHREVIYAVLNKPVISNGEWSFTATHEFTPSGDVISYFAGESDFERPEDSHCDQCGKNRKRERVYTVTNNDGVRKQIGSSCLALFMGVRPEGLWSLNSDKMEEELSDIESLSLGGTTGILYPLRKIIGIALAETNGGESYVSRAVASMKNPATADIVSMAMSKESEKTFDEGSVNSVMDFIRKVDSDGSDYLDNLKAIFGKDDDEEVFVKDRHLGIAASAVSAWYRDSHKAEKKPDKLPPNPEYVGVEDERTKNKEPVLYKVHRRFSYETDYGTTVGYVLRDPENRQLLWKSSSNHPDVWEGGTVEIAAFTVKKHEVDSYSGDNQTLIQRPSVKDVTNIGKAPDWKISQLFNDVLMDMTPEKRQEILKEYEAAEYEEDKLAIAMGITGIKFG